MGNIFLSILGISASIGLFVIALIFLTPFLNKRYAVKWKYLIWIFLALRLLIPISGTNVQYVMDRLSRPKVEMRSESEENDADDPTDMAMPYRGIVVEIPAQMTTPIKASSEKNTTDMTMLDIVTFVWMIGSLIFISVHLISYSHYKRQVIKRGRAIKETRILSQIFQLKRELHIRRTVRIMEYDEAGSPMIIGFIKPVLVLPREQYDSEDLFFIPASNEPSGCLQTFGDCREGQIPRCSAALSLILKHELVHLKRGDVYLKLLFVTANAVHWFNPLIWIMQKEAVIDMELSCDERVTKGADFAFRKAYTETLLSMLHKQCVRKTVLSTQFYGGTKIMKKRFKNILIRNRKKNGILILICAVVSSVALGMQSGCSVTKQNTEKENTEKENIENGDAANEDMENVSQQSGTEADQTVSKPADNSAADNHPLERAKIRELKIIRKSVPLQRRLRRHILTKMRLPF